jgi:hypothetical protein
MQLQRGAWYRLRCKNFFDPGTDINFECMTGKEKETWEGTPQLRDMHWQADFEISKRYCPLDYLHSRLGSGLLL